MKTIDMTIPDMQSTHCQARVNNALKTIEGVQVQTSEAGRLSVSLENEHLEKEVIGAIEKAGYHVEQAGTDKTTGSASDCSGACCTN